MGDGFEGCNDDVVTFDLLEGAEATGCWITTSGVRGRSERIRKNVILVFRKACQTPQRILQCSDLIRKSHCGKDLLAKN